MTLPRRGGSIWYCCSCIPSNVWCGVILEGYLLNPIIENNNITRNGIGTERGAGISLYATVLAYPKNGIKENNLYNNNIEARGTGFIFVFVSGNYWGSSDPEIKCVIVFAGGLEITYSCKDRDPADKIYDYKEPDVC